MMSYESRYGIHLMPFHMHAMGSSREEQMAFAIKSTQALRDYAISHRIRTFVAFCWFLILPHYLPSRRVDANVSRVSVSFLSSKMSWPLVGKIMSLIKVDRYLYEVIIRTGKYALLNLLTYSELNNF